MALLKVTGHHEIIAAGKGDPPRAAPPARERTLDRRGARRAAVPAPAVVDTRPLPTATQALDRITIPQEAVDRISELLIPGSSMVISDEGLGRETGRFTEFIVLTK